MAKLPLEPPDGKCGAKTRKGTPCQRKAGAGTGHVGIGRCANHLGATDRSERVAAVHLARKELQVMGRPLPIHPIDAILQCVSIAAGEVQYASDRIAELTEGQAVGPVISTRPLKLEKGAEDPTERTYEEGPPALHIWIEVRHNAMDRLAHYSKVALAAGVAERQIRLAENQAQLLAQAVKGILTDLGVINRPDAPAIVRRHLELVGNTINGTATDLPSVPSATNRRY